MNRLRTIFLILGWLAALPTLAQTAPFTGIWSFEGDDNGSSTNTFINVSSVSYKDVNKFGANPYTTGYVNLGVNIQNWLTGACTNSEYAEFSVQPTGTARLTLNVLSFAFSRTAQGPQQVSVRSSADGFGADIFSQSTSENYQVATISLSSPAFTDQSGSITFRIYGCNPMAGGGLLKLDEIQLSGSSLPVTLLSFTAKPDGNRVQLAWTTTAEQNADRFIVERSTDLTEFIPVGEVPAKGTTDQRQDYGLTDPNPTPGTNYYRLKQRDLDGVTTLFKPVSAIVRTDEPAISVYPSPVDADRIHLRLWNADGATVRLLNVRGQTIQGQLNRTPGEADFRPAQPLVAGLYVLEVLTQHKRQVLRVLVK